jgi:hypothetical protein
VAPAFDAYWRSEVAPVLGSGRRPPLAAGFQAFVAAPHVATAIASTLAEQRAATVSDALDTHPPLGERLAALAKLPPGEPLAHDPPAITLLDDVPNLERALVGHLAPDARLEPVAWEAVGLEVCLPDWKETLAKRGAALAAVPVAELPAALSDVRKLAATIVSPAPDADEARAVVVAVAGMKVGVALHDAGWAVEALPGRPVEFVRGDARVNPRDWVGELLDGTLDAAAWRARCADAGVPA